MGLLMEVDIFFDLKESNQEEVVPVHVNRSVPKVFTVHKFFGHQTFILSLNENKIYH